MNAFRWQSTVDFMVLATAVYLLLGWSRQARALRMALAVLALRVGVLLARQLDLVITIWVLDAATVIALLALVVVFQPELRRALMRLDVTRQRSSRDTTDALAAISSAAWALARARCGALMVVARKDSLAELVTSGITLGGRVSPDVLMAIFQKGSPVHDGAVIVEGDLIARVGAILPLTQRRAVREHFGTRHRAGMGLAERSDALVVVSSEERGEVTVMWEDQVRLMTSAGDLLSTLNRIGGAASAGSPFSRLGLRSPSTPLALTAVGVAALVWSLTFLFPGRSVRVRTVPIEFVNVPTGLTIAAPSTDTLEVWLRANQFLLETVNLDSLVARCDLSAAHEGMNAVPLTASAIDAPFGIRVEAMAPQQIQVRLIGHPRARPNG